MREFLQRPYHYFISYSHRDSTFAKALKHWLSERSGLRIWFDEHDLGAGDQVHAGIAASVSQCRGIIFLLSEASLKSEFVRDELQQALSEKKEQPHFQIVLLRLDNCDVSAKYKEVRHLKWHDLQTSNGPELPLAVAAELLCRIHAFDGWQYAQSDRREVFVSRRLSDRNDDMGFPDALCQRLAARALRLVGDLPDQSKTDLSRVQRIMESCWGHAMILPRRESPNGPEDAYKRYLPEFELSTSLSIPKIVFAEQGSTLPPTLAKVAIMIDPETLLSKQASSTRIPADDAIDDFVDDLRQPVYGIHAFFASQFKGSEIRNQLARTVIETTGSLPCLWGKDITEMGFQVRIRDAIVSSRFVAADLASRPSEDNPARLQINNNACIEAAIAWGADIRTLFFTFEIAGTDESKTKAIPVMLRSAQLNLYKGSQPGLADGVDFLGVLHHALLKDRKVYGRRVINYELV